LINGSEQANCVDEGWVPKETKIEQCERKHDETAKKLANFIRDSPTQFLRFAAGHDRFTDASHGLMSVAVAFVCDDPFCVFLDCDTR
jgi:hypothetical protein